MGFGVLPCLFGYVLATEFYVFSLDRSKMIKPGWLAQLERYLTHDLDVVGTIPGCSKLSFL